MIRIPAHRNTFLQLLLVLVPLWIPAGAAAMLLRPWLPLHQRPLLHSDCLNSGQSLLSVGFAAPIDHHYALDPSLSDTNLSPPTGHGEGRGIGLELVLLVRPLTNLGWAIGFQAGDCSIRFRSDPRHQGVCSADQQGQSCTHSAFSLWGSLGWRCTPWLQLLGGVRVVLHPHTTEAVPLEGCGTLRKTVSSCVAVGYTVAMQVFPWPGSSCDLVYSLLPETNPDHGKGTPGHAFACTWVRSFHVGHPLQLGISCRWQQSSLAAAALPHPPFPTAENPAQLDLGLCHRTGQAEYGAILFSASLAFGYEQLLARPLGYYATLGIAFHRIHWRCNLSLAVRLASFAAGNEGTRTVVMNGTLLQGGFTHAL